MSRYRQHHRTNFRLIRTVIGIVASFILLFAPTISSANLGNSYTAGMAMAFANLFATGSFFFALLGAIISYWKRRFGAIFMFIGAVFGIGLMPLGGIALLALVMLAFCIISSYWHVLPD